MSAFAGMIERRFSAANMKETLFAYRKEGGVQKKEWEGQAQSLRKSGRTSNSAISFKYRFYRPSFSAASASIYFDVKFIMPSHSSGTDFRI